MRPIMPKSVTHIRKGGIYHNIETRKASKSKISKAPQTARHMNFDANNRTSTHIIQRSEQIGPFDHDSDAKSFAISSQK